MKFKNESHRNMSKTRDTKHQMSRFNYYILRRIGVQLHKDCFSFY